MASYGVFGPDEWRRRQLLREHAILNGIDYVEVVTAPPADNQLLLRVYFIPKITGEGRSGLSTLLETLLRDREELSIQGGARVRDIRITKLQREGDHLEVRVSEPGDFSTYTLVIESELLDPVYSHVDFNFKAGCPARFDCRPRPVSPPEERAEPLVDYMAKDYASFRQALIDLIPTHVPGWEERHEADLGIALIELLAYVGDELSYYQDAVANEAYLETARQRVSVRRHARLIDYRMHDGASARSFIHLRLADHAPEEPSPFPLPRGRPVLTELSVPLGPRMPPHDPVIAGDEAALALDAADVVFETMTEARLHPRLNDIKIHTWGRQEYYLPRGTTSADLVGSLRNLLETGDFLLFEEVKSLQPGLAVNRARRQIVRLAAVEESEDPLLDVQLTRVTWAEADALRFTLWVSSDTQIDMGVARGNLCLADHGRTRPEELHPGPETPLHRNLQLAHRIRLREGPLSFRIPLPDDNPSRQPTAALLATDPRQAKPEVTRLRVGPTETPWKPVPSLLEDSGPFHPDFVVETDNEGRAWIRFGDGKFGMAPPEGAEVRAVYRVGVGAAGNVGAESLKHLIRRPEDSEWPEIVAVHNPLPAWGGIDPESVEEVKQLAPAAFHAEQFRAVTEADYARAAEKLSEVHRAVANFRWTGSWYTVFLTVDPTGRTDVPAKLERRVRGWVTRYMQTGYDLEIDPPIFADLELEIEVCAAPTHFRHDVEEAVLQALSSQVLPDGRRGFFHPDNFTFGQPLYVSRLYAAIEAVDGVDSAVVTRFARQHEFDPEPDRPTTRKNLDDGSIRIGRLEVVRLDNDPNFPENGVLRLVMQGGK